ncbi:MAG: adenylyltransferase [Actinomycetota bacterium]|nr:adenylyltransferase [Actinomycetota bacterium]
MQYVSGSGDEGSGGCVFCSHLGESDDEASHILYRGKSVFVILNAFPYNTGHLMVAPNRHVGELAALEPGERAELMELASTSTQVIADAMGAQGFNIGINVGQAAGAGIPGHLHLHVVPRWGGDTNFMPVTADTKVLPEMIADTDAKLRPGFLAAFG